MTRISGFVVIVLTALVTYAQEEDRSSRPDMTLSYGSPADVDMDADKLAVAARHFEDSVAKDDLRGVVLLVARHGTIVLHEAYGWRDVEKKKRMQKDSLFRMASNSKAVTAAGVLLLVDDGKICLDDPIHKYFPSFNQGDAAKITVRHLLTHTSGIAVGSLFVDPLVREPTEKYPDAPSILVEARRIGEKEVQWSPGSRWSYNNAGYNTLAALIESVGGSYKEPVRKRIYEPLGMNDSYNHESDADHSRMSAIFRSRGDNGWKIGWKPGDAPDYPFPRGSGGMISTTYDYAIFCQMFLNGGTYGGKQVLSEAMVKQAVNPQIDHIQAAENYGFGWKVSNEGGTFSHGGSDGTDAWIDPARGIIGCVFTQSPGAPDRKGRREKFRERVTDACTDNSSDKQLFTNPNASVDERVENLLQLLTLEEKAGFMAGKDLWFMKGVERLGIPSVQVTDCGHGVTVILDESGGYTGCATCFPTAVGQAASWDRELVYEIGRAIALETRDLGSAILLAPMVNIHRTPLGGRNYETYSEDPFLAGTLASSFIKGVQSQHIGAVIKAMTANNQQTNQQHLSVEVSERALREIYLPAFRIPVLDAKPWGVMTAYNGVNGLPTCASRHLISEILKGEWQYRGFVVSDWRSVKRKASIAAGLDIEMPGPGKFMATDDIVKAVTDGTLTREELDDRVGRYLRALVKSRLLDRDRPKLNAESNSETHQALARKAAEASIVLLKNSPHVLPLNRSKLRKLAVLGPNAEEARLGGGGSASVTACRTVSPLQGLEHYCGQAINIEFVEGVGMKGGLPILGNQYLTATVNGETVGGLRAEYFSNRALEGEPALVRIDKTVDFSWGWAAPCSEVGKGAYSVRWTGRVHAPVTGTYRMGVTCHEGGFRLYLNDKQVIDEWGRRPGETFEAAFSRKNKSVEIHLDQGMACAIRLEFHKQGNKNAIRLEWQVPGRHDPIDDAVRLASQSDAAIVFAGLSNLFEGGTNDREEIALPEGQAELIRAVAKANPKTIVVLINGTPLAMPWLEDVSSVLEAYYPGQEGGHAIARVLFGDVNPSGKLPETFPRRLEDNPSHDFFPGESTSVSYGEGIYVGYRHYDTKGIEPLFPFGYGLSYTSFEYSNLQIEQSKDGQVGVTLGVKNTGKNAGAEVVQLYVRDLESSVDRPDKELKGFAKIELQPGETKEARIQLDRDAFAFFSPTKDKWVVETGDFELLVGSSSRDIRLSTRITVE